MRDRLEKTLAENEPPGEVRRSAPSPPPDDQEVVLAELVSRVLDRGVVVAGDVTISVAGIDLVYLGLSLRLAATETLLRRSRARDRLPSSALAADEKADP
jgi:hypothetical protein